MHRVDPRNVDAGYFDHLAPRTYILKHIVRLAGTFNNEVFCDPGSEAGFEEILIVLLQL